MTKYLSAINHGSTNFGLDNSLLRRTQNGVYLIEPRSKSRPAHFFHLTRRLGDSDMSLQDIEQKLLQIPSFNGKVKSGAYCIEPLQTKLGHKIGRVSRPVQGLGSSAAFAEADEFVSAYFNRMRHVMHLYERLLDFGRSVDLSPLNLQVHGNATRDLLIVACFEVEAIFKLLIFEDFQTARGNISLYWNVAASAKLSDYQIGFPDIPTIAPLTPFSQWSGSGATKYTPLNWYQSYNTIKHNAIEGNAPATLANVLNALAACYALLTALAFPSLMHLSSNKRVQDKYTQSFDVFRKPEWSAGEHYWKLPGLPLRFSEVI